MTENEDRIDSCYCAFCHVVHSVLVPVETCLEERALRLLERFTPDEVRVIRGE